jgi:hypothetical protein
MKRTSINPWPWSLQVGYNQAEAVSGHTTHLYCSGQSLTSSPRLPWLGIGREADGSQRSQPPGRTFGPTALVWPLN